MNQLRNILGFAILFFLFSSAVWCDGQGTAKFVPESLNASTTETFTLVYTAGEEGLVSGSQLRILDPNFHGMHWKFFQRFQTNNGTKPGYLTAETDVPGVNVVLRRNDTGSVGDPSETLVTVVSGKLNAGTHTYTFNGSRLASGIYYYQLISGDYKNIKKMILVR